MVYTREVTSSLTPDSTSVEVDAVCDPGDIAVSGGWRFSQPTTSWLVSGSSIPAGAGDRWRIRAFHREDGPQRIIAQVVCAASKQSRGDAR